LRVAQRPIIVKLTPYIPRNSTEISDVAITKAKTKPELFQRVLGLRSGENFTMNFDRWIELQSCGLFANLTAKSFVVDEELYLEVYGRELSSVSFTPEISLEGIKERPQMTGGVNSITFEH
jgi:hypothetical protein